MAQKPIPSLRRVDPSGLSIFRPLHNQDFCTKTVLILFSRILVAELCCTTNLAGNSFVQYPAHEWGSEGTLGSPTQKFTRAREPSCRN